MFKAPQIRPGSFRARLGDRAVADQRHHGARHIHIFEQKQDQRYSLDNFWRKGEMYLPQCISCHSVVAGGYFLCQWDPKTR